MTADALRAAGYPDEAERLEAARRRSDAWSLGTDRTTDRALAVSVFGSRRYDDLADQLGIQRWSS